MHFIHVQKLSIIGQLDTSHIVYGTSGYKHKVYNMDTIIIFLAHYPRKTAANIISLSTNYDLLIRFRLISYAHNKDKMAGTGMKPQPQE